MDQHSDHIFNISEILSKHLKGIPLDDNEEVLLKQWLDENHENESLFLSLKNNEQLADSLKQYFDTDTEAQLAVVNNKINASKGKTLNMKWLSIAASILVILSAGGWLYFKNNKGSQSSYYAVEDFLPGKNKAFLTLSTGEVINLDEKQNEIAISANGISYSNGEQISETNKVQFAKLQTPRGGTYSIKLPDGTKVWLNAGSELEYPLHFTTSTREVKLKGEGYFEVAHDKSHPFIVRTDIQQIKVLGTSFNIRAYTHQQATTLITGKVAVRQIGNNSEIKITPGEQASVHNGNMQVSKVDVSDFTSWKEGFLAGNSVKFQDIAAEVERWYDVEFVYPSGFKNNEKAFFSVNRNEKLSSVLKALERTYGIHFQIKGKEVLIKQ